MADLVPLIDCCLQTNREKWSNSYTPEDLSIYLALTFDLERMRCSLNSTTEKWFLAIDTSVNFNNGGKIVGYALGCPCDLPHEDANATDGEVFYVRLISDDLYEI